VDGVPGERLLYCYRIQGVTVLDEHIYLIATDKHGGKNGTDQTDRRKHQYHGKTQRHGNESS
ncbi:MAG: hypothetical protein Q8J76_04980, partial [Desulfobulbaceae bacterium]|nr:hypothetical protein [Desulfobulbaceae bacterium]